MAKDEQNGPEEHRAATDDTSGAGEVDQPTEKAAPLEPASAVLRIDESELSPLLQDVVKQFRTIYDPEIPVDIYELGLIYEFKVDATGQVWVKMTLTSPMCPVAGSLPGEVEAKVQEVDGVNTCAVDLVFDPPWVPTLMTDAARLTLNMGGMNL